MSKNNIAELIRQRRAEAKLSQGELAKRLGTSQQHVSAWERAVWTPGPRMARALAGVLGGNLGDYLPC